MSNAISEINRSIYAGRDGNVTASGVHRQSHVVGSCVREIVDGEGGPPLLTGRKWSLENARKKMDENVLMRVAAAISAASSENPENFVAVARAAIEAMREPNKAMEDAGEEMLFTSYTASCVWDVMIDKALS